jgi:hypothetical protein
MTLPIPASWIVAGVVVLAAGAYVWRCEAIQDDMVRAEAIAQQQAAENARKALEALKAKERADENYTRNLDRLRADLKRLRNARTDFVPAPSASAPSPDRACFDREQLERAIRSLDSGVQALIERGDEALIGLEAAREAWPKP